MERAARKLVFDYRHYMCWLARTCSDTDAWLFGGPSIDERTLDDEKQSDDGSDSPKAERDAIALVISGSKETCAELPGWNERKTVGKFLVPLRKSVSNDKQVQLLAWPGFESCAYRFFKWLAILAQTLTTRAVEHDYNNPGAALTHHGNKWSFLKKIHERPETPCSIGIKSNQISGSLLFSSFGSHFFQIPKELLNGFLSRTPSGN